LGEHYARRLRRNGGRFGGLQAEGVRYGFVMLFVMLRVCAIELRPCGEANSQLGAASARCKRCSAHLVQDLAVLEGSHQLSVHAMDESLVLFAPGFVARLDRGDLAEGW
jgi:hypothetical protein